MNKIVEQLYQQSFIVDDYVNVGPTGPELGIRFDPEKFAELIIQEMCQVMKAEGEQFSLDQNFHALKGVGRCMRRVKEHFGVDQ